MAIDITDMPELLSIAEEVRRTRRPRVLRRGAEDVALVTPLLAEITTEDDDIAPADASGTTAVLAAGGSWKGLVDADELKAQLHAARGSHRSAPPL